MNVIRIAAWAAIAAFVLGSIIAWQRIRDWWGGLTYDEITGVGKP